MRLVVGTGTQARVKPTNEPRRRSFVGWSERLENRNGAALTVLCRASTGGVDGQRKRLISCRSVHRHDECDLVNANQVSGEFRGDDLHASVANPHDRGTGYD